MGDKNLIKLTYWYFNPNSINDPEGYYGSLIIDPLFPSEVWGMTGGMDVSFAEDLILSMKDHVGKPPYELKDFMTEDVVLDLSDVYSYITGEVGGYLEAEAEIINSSSISPDTIWKTSLPEKMKIRGIRDFKNLMVFRDQSL